MPNRFGGHHQQQQPNDYNPYFGYPQPGGGYPPIGAGAGGFQGQPFPGGHHQQYPIGGGHQQQYPIGGGHQQQYPIGGGAFGPAQFPGQYPVHGSK